MESLPLSDETDETEEIRMAQITCKDLTLGYETGVVAEHISFSVEEGDYLCIVGENGSGKSTLMKTLLGLTPPLG